ncbi:CCHC-type domain-containing protein [Trichonephila inaurata madagascariensis]|uniref:CCHC-type domain-containing protein n=1 Tax=Trichonephila inaurata madagascariensis TaxID=2747483 RepID=A0A8X6Y8F5_9ARAC|nr:CCHC-type domain-containing protein [Trichonephila inaurata madagascariensis]
MKSVAEDVYRSLLVKNISSTSDFIKECQLIEEMNRRRIVKHRFTRLPNVVPVASIEHESLLTLIRHIGREEVQRMFAPTRQNTLLEYPSLDEVKREVQQALCLVIPSRSVAVNRRNEPPRRPRTQTDVWKPDDNRPVCFHCGNQTTRFVTAVNDELFSTHTETAKEPTVSYYPLTCPLTNAAGKRLEHYHHLLHAGEDHQYADIDHPLNMGDIIPANLPAAETRKTK